MSTPSKDQNQTPSSPAQPSSKNKSGKPESGSEQLDEARNKREQGLPPPDDDKTITGTEETVV